MRKHYDFSNARKNPYAAQLKKPVTIRLDEGSMPNPSLKRSANGRPPGPVWRYAVHFRQPGPGVLPSSPA
jgi:hypothetical protein